jgi:putative ABC transport system permease protein
MRRLAFALLEHLTDPALADSIAGDLEEEGHRRAATSRAVAIVWFWRELIAIAMRALLFRVRDAITFARPFRLTPRLPDFRYGLRVLRNHPWYSVTAIGVIALTMTLATTVFGVVDDVLFPALPYPRPQELYHVGGTWSDEALARSGRRLSTSRGGVPLSVRDVQDLSGAIPEVGFAAYTVSPGAHVPGSIGPWRPLLGAVGPRFFDVLGVYPETGGFASADFEPVAGAPVPALVAHAVWRTQFGGRLDIVGLEYVPDPDVATERYRIAGVLPPTFRYPFDGSQPDFLTPLSLTRAERQDRQKRLYEVIARVPAGESPSAYQDRFDVVTRAAAADLPDRAINGGAGPADLAAVQPIAEWLGMRPRWMATQVLGAALLLVLLGCVNVSGLVAARGVDRGRELALRRALGAGAGDVAGLVLAEAACVVASGTVLGIALAVPTLTFVARVMPAAIAPARVPAIDWRVLTFALAVSATSVVAVCVWPLVCSLSEDARPRLADGGQLLTPARSRGRRIAVGLQAALGLLITICGAFVVGSLVRAIGQDLGFTSEHVVVLEGRYPPAMPVTRTNEERAVRLVTLRRSVAGEVDNLLTRVRAREHVEAAGASHGRILRREGAGSGYGDNYAITEGFVEALRPRLVAGRWPTSAEIAQGARVAVISETVARRVFPGESPIGRTIRNYAGGGGMLDVIGVAEAARYRAWDDPSGHGEQVFAPYRATAFDPRFTVVVRVTDPKAVLAWAVEEARRPSGPLRLTAAAMADDLIVDTVRTRTFQSWVFGIFTAASLAIVGTGIFGLAAMTSVSRRREIGIRLTLGATRRRIVAQLLGEQIVSIGVGGAVGAIAGLSAAAMLYGSYVYGVQPSEPGVWIAAFGTVLVTATVGILIPARRASRTDPVTALRCE